MPKYISHLKEAIQQEARRMIVEDGLEKLSIRAVASRCGIAIGTLYNYYKSKEEVVADILQTDWNSLLTRIDLAAEATEDTLSKLQAVYSELRLFMQDAHKIWSDTFYHLGKKEDLQGIRQSKLSMFSDLSRRIQAYITRSDDNQDWPFLTDVICRLLLSYSHRNDIPFEKLKIILTRLLAQA